ncbi:MAG: anhydro-N-acetylmuramic acid kinase [Hyphomicrobiales bacterium]
MDERGIGMATEPKWSVGVISGTSMDGIDVALLRTDGRELIKHGHGATLPYPAWLREALISVINTPAQAESGDLSALEDAVTDAHCDAVSYVLDAHNISSRSITCVGLHGQTVFHRPEHRFTRQLMNGRRAADRLRLTCVNRFRHADLAAGGQGAPLVPLYHQALARHLEQPVMVLNLGGVANVTSLDDDIISAFDTGPASAMIDDFVRQRTGQPFDTGGALAARGHADEALVAAFLAHPYFSRPAPKSLDRNAFHDWMKLVAPLSDADGAATLTRFTVESVAAALKHVPRPPKRWLACGGGRLNGFLMHALRERLGVPVDPVESVGWNGDFLEAECFAWLAVRSIAGLPLSVPSTTGVPEPMRGGEIWRPEGPSR